jgi:hypothetical protein
MVKSTWRIWKVAAAGNGPELLFETDDPAKVVFEAHRMEQEAIDKPPHRGLPAGTYYIEGDETQLPTVQVHSPEGDLLHGPKRLWRPPTR